MNLEVLIPLFHCYPELAHGSFAEQVAEAPADQGGRALDLVAPRRVSGRDVQHALAQRNRGRGLCHGRAHRYSPGECHLLRGHRRQLEDGGQRRGRDLVRGNHRRRGYSIPS
jgi:hypothetical protein